MKEKPFGLAERALVKLGGDVLSVAPNLLLGNFRLLRISVGNDALVVLDLQAKQCPCRVDQKIRFKK